MATAKGVQTNTWPKMMVNNDNGMPTDNNTTSNAMAMMISGKTIGSMIKPIKGAAALNWYRVLARAASVPKIVDNTAVAPATNSEFFSAFAKTASFQTL